MLLDAAMVKKLNHGIPHPWRRFFQVLLLHLSTSHLFSSDDFHSVAKPPRCCPFKHAQHLATSTQLLFDHAAQAAKAD
jgi:hypothetical protein